ncbi:MAG: histidine kinase [Acidobacteria bacterium]|nr:histidine kinase [Acidobacteriota bacterium]
MRFQPLTQHFRRRLRKRFSWGIVLGFTLLFGIFKATSLAKLHLTTPSAVWVSVLFTPFAMSFAYGFLTPLPWRYTGDDRSHAPLLRGALQAAPCCALIITTLVMVDYGLLHLAGWGGSVPVDGQDHPMKLGQIMTLQLVIGTPMMMFIGGTIALGERTEEEKATAETQLREAQWVLLRGQLSPHVLFNSLNGLAELVRQDVDRAEQAILDLAELYRALLRHGDRPLAPLADERDLVRHYLAVEKLRLGTRLRVHWEWDEELDKVLAPPFLLQPLVENALKHGIAGHTEGGEVRIKGQRIREAIHLQVANTGRPASLVLGEGIGLRNLEARLKLAYGDRARFQLHTEYGWTLADVDAQGDAR